MAEREKLLEVDHIKVEFGKKKQTICGSRRCFF